MRNGGEYREYSRNEFRPAQTGEEPYTAHPGGESQGEGDGGLRGSRYGRDILTATSDDFLHWTEPSYVRYSQGRPNELYTNQVTPYFRAPHLFLGFPARYVERPWSEAVEQLPEPEHRRMRADISERYGAALTDGLFMSSRDGDTFHLWPDPFILPGLRPRGRLDVRRQLSELGDSLLRHPRSQGAPQELSFYVREGYWRAGVSALRRYTLRIDGFASLQAPLSGGELVTKPLIFCGRTLTLNFSASAAGSVRVALLRDQMNAQIEGFSLEDSVELLGDDLARVVRWKGDRDLGSLAGAPVRLHFVLKDADLFSLRFSE